mgnify:CR=1 FL=1
MSYEIACRIQHETDDVILIEDETMDEPIWIPLSQVEEIHRTKGGLATVVMTDWIAQRKGLL